MKQKRRLWVSSEIYWRRVINEPLSPKVLCGHATITVDFKIKFGPDRNNRSRIFRSILRASAHSSSSRKETHNENCKCSFSMFASCRINCFYHKSPSSTGNKCKFCREKLGLIAITFRQQKVHSVNKTTFPKGAFCRCLSTFPLTRRQFFITSLFVAHFHCIYSY